MIKRTAIAILWFLATWTVAAMLAFVLALPAWVVPLAAIAAAVVMFGATGTRGVEGRRDTQPDAPRSGIAP